MTRAVLHGILVGPTVPTVDERRSIQVPTLVLGHRADLIHPFSDAAALVRQMPNARRCRRGSMVELRRRPRRLRAHIERFLGEVWDERSPVVTVVAG